MKGSCFQNREDDHIQDSVAGDGGFSEVEIDHVRQHAQEDWRQRQQRQDQHRGGRLRLMSPELGFVIEDDNADAVEGMVDHREDQAEFAQGEERRLIGGDGFDVEAGIKDGPGGVNHMQRQEEHDADAGEAMQRPAPLPDGAAVTQSLAHGKR